MTGHNEEAWAGVEPVSRNGEEGGETLPEQIASRIAELIETEQLGPGSRLPSERELARMFGVSRLAVREAAHRLEARRLIVVRRGAGSFVASGRDEIPDPAETPLTGAVDLEELADVRMLLEPAAAEWAARRANRSTVGLLVRIAEQFESAVAASERRFDLLAASDVQLHLELAYCADNELLGRLIRQLHDPNRLQLEWSLRRPGRLEETAVEHRRIVDAVAAGYAAAAREAMQAHLIAASASLRAAASAQATPLD